MESDIDMSAPSETDRRLKITSDILEYDVPVDVKAPPADKVVESPGG